MTAAPLLAAAAGACAAWGTVDGAAAWAAVRRAERPAPRSRAAGALRALGRPLAPAAPARLRDRLDAAGLATPVADVAAVKAGGATAALLLALPLVAGAPLRLGVLLVAAAPAAGWFAPDLMLVRIARRRAERIARELPDVLDLLRVAVAAGLPPVRALAEVGRRHPGVLAAELARVAAHEKLGVPRERALAGLRRRAPLPALHALSRALERAARHGAPLDAALEALADDARAQAARAEAERGARAAPKIQLVVALVLVPSVLLLVAAALIPGLSGQLP